MKVSPAVRLIAAAAALMIAIAFFPRWLLPSSFFIVWHGKAEQGSTILALGAIQSSRITESHITENVPDAADFERFLQRDLQTYFADARKEPGVTVDYEPLRRGVTQSGLSYPRFYLWVRISGGKSTADRGAVRLSAIDKKRFEITDFVSEQTIRDNPDSISTIFPALVCETIRTKVTR